MRSSVGVPRVAELLVATLSLVAMGCGVALAQDQPSPPPNPSLAQAATITFSIPAQPLASALTAFGRQSGIQVLVDSASVAGKTSAPVTGALTAVQALQQLLGGTGVPYRFTSPTAVMVGSGAAAVPGALQLDPVQVQGAFPVPSQAMIDNIPPPYAGGQVATGGQLGMLGNRPVMDTPFNQTSYTAKKAQDQQATTVKDVLLDDPSVRPLYNGLGLGADHVRIRGFLVGSGEMTYGGLYGMLPSNTVMAEMADRVEVLKGPSVLLNGMPPNGAIGGTVNVVPKRAPDTPLLQATAAYASAGQFAGNVDLGYRFGTDKQFGVRFNGAFRAGQTEISGNSDQRSLATLGLDFRGETARVSIDLGYQYQYIGGVLPYIGVGAGIPIPWTPNARSNYGEPWNYVERKDAFAVIRGEVDMTERVTAYATFGVHDNRVGQLTGGNNLTLSNINGTATSTPNNLSSYNQYLTVEAGVRGRVDTGPVNHEIALTATAYEQIVGTGSVNGTAYITNIYNPTIVARPAIATPAANKSLVSRLSTIGLADTFSLADKRIQLTAGARWQQVGSSNFNTTTGAPTSNYDATAISPAVALIFKPWDNVSFYGNFIQGLQQGIIVGNTFANAGTVFPPYVSTQYEAGVKVDWGRFTTTASLFQISQPSVLTNVVANTLELAGEQRNQGLELNFFGEPVEGVRLLGGVMLLSAVLAKTQGGLTDGWVAPLSPATQVNLSAEWDLPFVRGLTVSGRVTYTASQYIDTAWPRRSLPEWTRLDLGLRYMFENPGAPGQPLALRFNVENVLDANYWAGANGANTLTLGLPRTFRLALTADF